MRLFLSLVLLMAFAPILGCSETLVVPSGPAAIEVHLTANYDNHRAIVWLDDDRVFDERITTNDVLSLAAVVPLSIPDGRHTLRVQARGETASMTFDTADPAAFFGVWYDVDQGALRIVAQAERPLYD